MNTVAIRALSLVLAFACTCVAQNWRTEVVRECGIQFDAPSRLERLPMKLGSADRYRRARLRPKDVGDLIKGQYAWYCDVYCFPKKARGKQSFGEWLSGQKGVEVLTEGKQRKGRGGRLPYRHWVYVVDGTRGLVNLTYCEAAVYEFDDREVALVIEMPLEKRKPKKPKSKWASLIKRMIRSGKACAEVGDDEEDRKRDRYADSPERRQALARAKANIDGLQGWDYFTQPNYIVLYSWDFEKPAERAKARRQAKFYSERLEKMRALYMELYPLDATGSRAVMPDPGTIPGRGGPITGAPASAGAAEASETGRRPYSVFRLCATYEQFRKYGQSPPGVVGWYSPASKELVVFLGGDRMMGKGATETVTYHEGWHQYADFYFHPPGEKRHATLHRWFDEGHGDYFGSFRWGTGGWRYVGSKMRYQSCQKMVRDGDYVPFRDIVRWDRRRFYGRNAPYYYAQAFSMIDFLRRGQDSRGFEPRWAKILDDYRKVVLVEGDAELAVETAFRGFGDDDYRRLEKAWKAWVASSRFKKG